MKTWNAPEVMEVKISATASGKNAAPIEAQWSDVKDEGYDSKDVNPNGGYKAVLS